jgi:hypothetical protein
MSAPGKDGRLCITAGCGRLQGATAKTVGRSAGGSNWNRRGAFAAEMERATSRGGPSDAWLPDMDSKQGPADISSLRNQSPGESSRLAASRCSETSSWTDTQVLDRQARKEMR